MQEKYFYLKHFCPRLYRCVQLLGQLERIHSLIGMINSVLSLNQDRISSVVCGEMKVILAVF